MTKKTYTREFKLKVVRAVESAELRPACGRIAAAARHPCGLRALPNAAESLLYSLAVPLGLHHVRTIVLAILVGASVRVAAAIARHTRPPPNRRPRCCPRAASAPGAIRLGQVTTGRGRRGPEDAPP